MSKANPKKEDRLASVPMMPKDPASQLFRHATAVFFSKRFLSLEAHTTKRPKCPRQGQRRARICDAVRGGASSQSSFFWGTKSTPGEFFFVTLAEKLATTKESVYSAKSSPQNVLIIRTVILTTSRRRYIRSSSIGQ